MDVERRVVLQPGLRAPGEARRAVSAALSPHLGREDVETVALLVSELVTNVVLHAGTGCEVHVALTGRTVRLRVLDGDARQPVRRLAPSDELVSGRGLRLLEVLSTRWGVEPTRPPDPPGKAVWCDVPVSRP